MNWNEILTQIILWVVGGVLTAVGGMITYFIQTKVKNEKIKNILLAGTDVVGNALDYVQQTYVSNLKGTDAWNKEAMAEANKQAKEYIINNLSVEMKNYLSKNGKDLTEWAQEQIEIVLQSKKVK